MTTDSTALTHWHTNDASLAARVPAAISQLCQSTLHSNTAPSVSLYQKHNRTTILVEKDRVNAGPAAHGQGKATVEATTLTALLARIQTKRAPFAVVQEAYGDSFRARQSSHRTGIVSLRVALDSHRGGFGPLACISFTDPEDQRLMQLPYIASSDGQPTRRGAIRPYGGLSTINRAFGPSEA